MPDGTRKLEVVLRWALFLAYAAVTFVLTLRHEPWADELQAWLIARDCTVPEIFKMMRWEGHFVPWYLMLHVFAAHGGPVQGIVRGENLLAQPEDKDIALFFYAQIFFILFWGFLFSFHLK